MAEWNFPLSSQNSDDRNTEHYSCGRIGGIAIQYNDDVKGLPAIF